MLHTIEKKIKILEMNSMCLPLNASLAKSLISSACSRLEFVDSTILVIWENMVCVELVHQLTNFITKSMLHDKLADTSRNKKKQTAPEST